MELVPNRRKGNSQQSISTVKSFVEQQQYFFDMLWNKSIPLKQRIKEIEEGLICSTFDECTRTLIYNSH
jgi:hypothetical protein